MTIILKPTLKSMTTTTTPSFMLSSSLFLLLLLLLSVLPTSVVAQDYTCDLLNDKCPTRQNGECESSLSNQPSNNPACRNGDCLDCNYLCAQFDYDCTGCLTTAGCYWCPGDGTCNNSPHYMFNAKSTCEDPTDYIAAPDAGRCSITGTTFSDPLMTTQSWVFDQIDIQPVWSQGIFGSNVRIRINDDGVDPNQEEWNDRFSVDDSCELYEPQGVGDNAGHGTAVASILGASGNNSICAVGIAPEVNISSCNAFALQGVETFVGFDTKVDRMDISQNSIGVVACSENDDIFVRRRRRRELRRQRNRRRWELYQLENSMVNHRQLQNTIEDNLDDCPFVVDDSDAAPCTVCDFSSSTETSPSEDCETAIVDHCDNHFIEDEMACLDFLDLLIGGNACNYNKIPDIMLDAIANGILQGRDGKGIIYVFASGNQYRTGEDVNFGGLTNSRLTITVGAVGKDGFHASYSTPGAAIVVSAPGGDGDSVSNHVTAVRGGGCNAQSIGTSFAAPVVSGVIALMLQVNPSLSWRDVQGILAQTSRAVTDDPNDDTMITNGAGLVHSNLYGFGIVNANAAVEAAKTWSFYCPETFLNVASGQVNALITDDSSTTPIISIVNVDNTTTATLDIEGDDEFIVESVVVLLDLQHFSRGDLEVILTSPSGTVSVLHPGRRPENTQLGDNERWKLMTVRNWGESPLGNWTLSMRDLREGDFEDCIDAPFQTSYLLTTIDCSFLAEEDYCVNGELDKAKFDDDEGYSDLLTKEYEGFTMVDACCACGGGFRTDDYQDILRQWRLVIYGRSETCEGLPLEGNLTWTLFPSDTPSAAPSMVPSREPTPTRAPTQSNKDSGPTLEEDPVSRGATIGASIGAFVLACCCIYAVLRDPSSSESKNRFSNNSSTNIKKSDTGRTEDAAFSNIEGEIA